MPTRIAVLAAILLLLSGCELINEESGLQSENRFESIGLLNALTIQEIEAYGFPVNAQYAVEVHQVIYVTPDAFGEPTLASGALAIPVGATGARPTVSYQHGTEVLKTAVAGVSGIDNPEALVAVLFATSGYIAVMPDYLGLGVSPGLHPYVHAATLASTTVDMIRAGQDAAASLQVKSSGDLYLVGYSEGGYATAAAQRLIESSHAAEFNLVASAPAAGPYDLSGTLVTRFRDATPYPATYYLPYVILAYDEIYDIYDSLSDVMRDPWDALIPDLFDGTHGAGEINDALPDIPIDLFRSTYLDAFDGDDNHPFRVALRDNDLLDWAPQTPTRLFHCVADDQMPFELSERAYAAYVANGSSQVELVPLEYGGHVDCVAPALLFVKLWFDGLSGASKRAAGDLDIKEAARLSSLLR